LLTDGGEPKMFVEAL
jgi:hypothetical protein